mgnify:CR=1 FL=1
MGIIVSVVFGLALTAPISSAALAAEGLSEVPASALTVAYHRLSQAERERAARERQSGDQ